MQVQVDHGLAVGALLSCTILAACVEIQPAGEIRDVSREIVGAPPTIQIGSSAQFGRPRLIEALDSIVVVYDYADAVLYAVDLSGIQRWRTGRKGAGPEEFGTVTDLSVGPDGDIWALDRGNERIAVMDASGRHRQLIDTSERAIQRLAVLSSGVLVALSGSDSVFLAMLHGDGTLGRAQPHPVGSLREMHPYFQQVILERGGGDSWALISLFTGELVVGRGDEVICTAELMTAQSIPTDTPPGEDWDVVAAGLAYRGDRVYVLPRPPGSLDLRLLDVFSDDCVYIHSIPLPTRAHAIAGAEAGIVIEVEDPEPRLLLLQLSPDGRPAAAPGN